MNAMIRPHYDPQLAAAHRVKRYAVLKGAFEFGKAIILPNREAGFVQCRVTHVKKQKIIKA